MGEEFRSWIEGLTFLILSTIFECLCVCVYLSVCFGNERSSYVKYTKYPFTGLLLDHECLRAGITASLSLPPLPSSRGGQKHSIKFC